MRTSQDTVGKLWSGTINLWNWTGTLLNYFVIKILKHKFRFKTFDNIRDVTRILVYLRQLFSRFNNNQYSSRGQQDGTF